MKDETGGYEIRVKGHLDETWADWLDGFERRLLPDGEMVLTGPGADQAALLGLLNRLNSLNLPVVAVRELKRKNRPLGES